MPRSRRDDYDGPLRSSRPRLGDDDGPSRPRERKYKSPKRTGRGVNPLLVFVLVGSVVVMLGVLVTLGIVFYPKLAGNLGQTPNSVADGGDPLLPPVVGENPRAAYEEVCFALRAQDYGRIYDRFDNQTQKFFASMSETFLKSLANGEHADKTGREAFVAFNRQGVTEKGREPFDFSLFKNTKAVLSAEDKGSDVSMLKISTTSGKVANVQMIKQDGTWRVALFGAKVR